MFEVAERMRSHINDSATPYEGHAINVSVSMGVAALLPGIALVYLATIVLGIFPNLVLQTIEKPVQAITQVYGGSVEAHSDGPRQGSRFEVRLPLYRNNSLPSWKPLST